MRRECCEEAEQRLGYNKLYSHNHAALKYRQKVNSYAQQR